MKKFKTQKTALSAMDKLQFASDNYAGTCPEALRALHKANAGFARSYGDDPWTAKAADGLRRLFERDCEVFFVFNGTAANALTLATLCQPYHSVICSEHAHIETDECGSPEFFSNGTKLLTAPGKDGKLDVAAAELLILKRSDIHYPKPRVVSITQPTELGTVYGVEELRAVGRLKEKYGLRMHMDGARFANAVASLRVHPSEITWKAGVDVLCFGGTKNGCSVGEAVVFFNKALAAEFAYRCKQGGQLASKMRFMAAQWVEMLSSGAWLKNARKANVALQTLQRKLRAVPGVEIVYPCQANALFVKMPVAAAEALKKRGWTFYSFIGTGFYRLMCSWDTREAAIEALVKDVRIVLKHGA
jgi:threonine aldolase